MAPREPLDSAERDETMRGNTKGGETRRKTVMGTRGSHGTAEALRHS